MSLKHTFHQIPRMGLAAPLGWGFWNRRWRNMRKSWTPEPVAAKSRLEIPLACGETSLLKCLYQKNQRKLILEKMIEVTYFEGTGGETWPSVTYFKVWHSVFVLRIFSLQIFICRASCPASSAPSKSCVMVYSPCASGFRLLARSSGHSPQASLSA